MVMCSSGSISGRPIHHQHQCYDQHLNLSAMIDIINISSIINISDINAMINIVNISADPHRFSTTAVRL
ncbi:hypothetical protein HYC85_002460 [Camellia sinensis]|uniref:Uncharacterized protein n=1 Tax=Camellia sinensis TaxID=4442 RepID=A0A7J7I9L3_CAMSI|nr:hypothetical protein HYC85_002460 [Camellia sinensis]